MDSATSLNSRFGKTLPFLGICFAAGVAIALWRQGVHFILTVTLGINLGMVLLGPYAAAALYPLRLNFAWGGHLRVLLCLLLATSTVLILAYFFTWSFLEFLMACTTAIAGTLLGHDAALAVLKLKSTRGAKLDFWMMVYFPAATCMAILGGYSILGFSAGLYRIVCSLIG